MRTGRWIPVFLAVGLLLCLGSMACHNQSDSPVPVGLAYADNPAAYTQGVAIPPNRPSNGGGFLTTFGVSPSLPPGLTLDPGTGVISGTPTAAASTAQYTVTGSNLAGATSVILTLTVYAPPLVLTGTVAIPSSSSSPMVLPAGSRLAADGASGAPALHTTPLGAGVTVNLIRIDSQGNQVGDVLATGTTDASGTYTLTTPAGFMPGPHYVVQAAAPSGEIQGFVTSTTANIDPYTQTTVNLVTRSLATAGASLSGLAAADVQAVQQTVLANSGNIALGPAPTVAAMVSALAGTVRNDVEDNNIVTSLGASTGVAGTVLGSGGTPLAGVKMLVRTFGDQVTMGATRTDAQGAYTVHVPPGRYIIGALNDTAATMDASAWWTGAGSPGATSMFKAHPVTVPATGTATADFALAAGGQLTGAVTASDTGLPLAGITVTLNDFASGQVLMFVKTPPDGGITFNVAPGRYYLSLRNSTLQPYATAVLDTSSPSRIGNNKCQASPINLSAGTTKTGSVALVPGCLLSGTISDPVTGPLPGIVVRFQDATASGAFAESTRTGADGTYRMWFQPGSYHVLVHGTYLQNLALNSGNSPRVVDISNGVGQITATLQDPDGNPVSQAFVYLYDTSNNMLSYEVSNADGTVAVYTLGTPGTVKMGFVIDDGETAAASSVFSATTPGTTPGNGTFRSLNAATAIPVPNPALLPTSTGTTLALGTVVLPRGALLTGKVAVGLPQPVGAGNQMVQVRTGTTGGTRMLNTRTMSDGSFLLSLPLGATLGQVIAFAPSASGMISTPPGSSPYTSPGNYALVDGIVMSTFPSAYPDGLNFQY